MDPVPQAPAVEVTTSRSFPPVYAWGGLIAAVGVLLVSVGALFTTLPGVPTAGLYPAWVAWVFRLAPIPAAVLLWAVFHEAEYKVRSDARGLQFRGLLGGAVRVPWHQVTDYFADCGRSPAAVAAAGGSQVHNATDDSAGRPAAPFAAHAPDYIVASQAGLPVFDEGLVGVADLAAEITRHIPEGLPTRWEEASWVTCPACGARTALSLWPVPAGQVVRYCGTCRAPQLSAETEHSDSSCRCGGTFSREGFTCLYCDQPLGERLPVEAGAFVVERRGALGWRRPWAVAGAVDPEPVQPAVEALEEDVEDATR